MEIIRGEFDKKRFESFIDAILAILMTILILFAVALFASNVLLMNLSFAGVVLYPLKKGYLKSDSKNRFSKRSDEIISIIGMFLLVVCIPLAYLNTYLPSPYCLW